MKAGVPESLVADIAATSHAHETALVHGGGDLVTDVATRLGKEQRFIVSPDGMKSRYTDRETAEIYTMVMSGLIAKRIVLALRSRGVNAVSISGLDGGLITAKRKQRLAIVDERGRKVMIDGGYTGRVTSVNGGLVGLLMSKGFVPVVSPVALGEGHEPLNIDGDRAASSLAAGIGADAAIFATNVDGVLLDGKLVEHIPAAGVPELLPRIGYGMQKKVLAASEAVGKGVKEAIICSGTRQDPVARAISHESCTVIT